MPPLHTAVRTVHLLSLHATTTHSSTNCTLIVPPCHHYTHQYELYTYCPSMPPLHTAVQTVHLLSPMPPLRTAVRTVHLSSLHATTTHCTHCKLHPPMYPVYLSGNMYNTLNSIPVYCLLNIMSTVILYTSLLPCVAHTQREGKVRTVKQKSERKVPAFGISFSFCATKRNSPVCS
jgi:hypothetical protein